MDQEKAKVLWVENDQLIKKEVSKNELVQLQIPSCRTFDSKYIKLSPPKLNYEQSYSDIAKIAALSDIHGQHDLFIQLLTSNGIINKEGDWSFGNGHFVIVGDVFDRGDQVTETLWFLYKLEQQAAKSGGKVHYLLGNHEIMVLNADLRYVSEKYQMVAEKMETTYDQLFDDSTLIGQWLRTKPVAISINDIAFAHAGFSPEFASRKFTIAETNRLFHQRIIDHSKERISQNDSTTFLAKSSGPIWYRGYFTDENFSKEQLTAILSYMKKKHIVVGHTSIKEVQTHYDGGLFSVDSSMKRGEYGELLIWENNTFYRGTLSGEKIQLSTK